jgi:hypothetical protein
MMQKIPIAIDAVSHAQNLIADGGFCIGRDAIQAAEKQ